MEHHEIEHAQVVNGKKIPVYTKYNEWHMPKTAPTKITSASDVFSLAKGILNDNKENALVLYLGNQNQIMGTELVPQKALTVKTLSTSAASVRANSAIIVNSKMESLDVNWLRKGLKDFGVGLLDSIHIINNGQGYESLANEGGIAESTGNYNKPPDKPPVSGGVGEPAPGEERKPGSKERQFVTSVKTELPELKVHGQYIPRSTDKLSIKAKNIIKDNIKLAEQMADEGTDDAAVAVGAELLKKYYADANAANDISTKEALYDRAEKLTTVMAEKLTELGRAVQAAYILSLQTPEGQLRFATNIIDKYNKGIEKTKGGLFGLRKKVPSLTPEQADFIQNEMKSMKEMPDGFEKALRFQKLQNFISDLVPSSLYDKIVTLWKAGLLTGIKTSGLNTLSNLSHFSLEALKDVPAMGVDSIASLFTKQRTIGLTTKGAFDGFVEGIKKGWTFIRTGFDERHSLVKLDYHRVNFGKSLVAKALQKYEEFVFGILGAEDQPFYYGAKARSISSQAIADGLNKGLRGSQLQKHVDFMIENPTDEMLTNAVRDAETCVFQNETILSKIARKIQQAPGGQFVVPFGRTPSAVAMQIINYSPIGIVKTIVQNAGEGKFDQREFSQGIGRGVLGIIPLFIGGVLYAFKLLNLDRPMGEKEQKLWELEGRVPNTVKINGTWRSIQVLGPAGNLLLIGGHFKREFQASGSASGAMITALAGSAKSFTEQTFLQGINQITSAINDPARSAEGYLKSIVSSIIPTIVSDVARSSDPKERRNESILQSLQARLPFFREMLEPRINVLGQEKDRQGNIFEVMADPSRPSRDISSKAVVELRRLWDKGYRISPTLLGDKEGYKALSQQQNTLLWKMSGGLIRKTLETVVTKKKYYDLNDDDKSSLIKHIISESQDTARVYMTVKETGNLKGDSLTAKLIDLRKGGLVNRTVLKKYFEYVGITDETQQ
jgi:hypothetical protein